MRILIRNQTLITMAYTKNYSYKGISSSRIASRYNQLMALIAAIVIGMIISATVNALPSSKSTPVAAKMTVNTEQQTR